MQGFAAFVEMTAARLEARATDRDREGSLTAASVYRRVAEELREDWATWRDQPITPEDGAKLSNYSANGLRAWMRRHGVETLTVGTLPYRPMVGAMDEEEDAEPSVTPPRTVRRARTRAPRPSPTLSATVAALLPSMGGR